MNITAHRRALEMEQLAIQTALDDDATRVTCRSYITVDGETIQFPVQQLTPALAAWQARQHELADPCNLWTGMDVELDGIGIYDELGVWAESETGRAKIAGLGLDFEIVEVGA